MTEQTISKQLGELAIKLEIVTKDKDAKTIKTEVLARIKWLHDEAKKTFTDKKLFEGWRKANKLMLDWYLRHYKDNPDKTIISKSKTTPTKDEKKKKPTVTKKVTKKADEKKAPKKPAKNVNAFGHREGTVRAFIDDLFLKGSKISIMTKSLMKRFDFTEEWAIYNIKYHINLLTKAGFKVVVDDDKVTLRSKAKK